jgi:subfamily B ATP-binding cassette protein MsbA
MFKNKYTLELFKRYLREILINIALLIGIMSLSVMGPLLLRNVLNSANNGFNKENVIVYFVLLTVLYMIKFFYNHFKFYFTEKFKNLETLNLYKKIFKMRYDKINSLEPTYITERVSSTIDTVFGLYVSSITGIFVSSLVMLITLMVIFSISKLLFCVFFIQIPLQYFGFQKLLNGEKSKLVEYGTKLQEVRARSSKNVKALVSDVNGIKQYGEHGIIIPLIQENIKDANQLEKKANKYAMNVCTILEYLSVCFKNSSYLLIIYMYINGLVSVGDLVYLNLVNDIYYSSIGDVINIQINLRNLKGSLSFVSDEIEKNYEENGELRLENISSIQGSLENIGYDDNLLIESGKFSFEKGDVVGVVGESGCGKSTFVKLLNKFNLGGSIFINNHDIMEYDNESLRDKILYLPQSTYLLPCSVKDNILIGNQDDLERWNQLINLDFMKRLIEGDLDKIVLENSSNLSGGDRQKIILGRIFMQNPDVIILDESFNAIDEDTGENLFEILKNIYSDRIILIISHSSKYIDRCNKLVSFSDKQLLQQGI